MSVDELINNLLEGNEKWAHGVDQRDPNFFKNSAKSQTPRVLWIGWYVSTHMSEELINNVLSLSYLQC